MGRKGVLDLDQFAQTADSNVERQDARIYWNSLGQGEPVVLVMGLGCSSAMWFRIAPQLARSHRVILLDNRGSGNRSAGFKRALDRNLGTVTSLTEAARQAYAMAGITDPSKAFDLAELAAAALAHAQQGLVQPCG